MKISIAIIMVLILPATVYADKNPEALISTISKVTPLPTNPASCNPSALLFLQGQSYTREPLFQEPYPVNHGVFILNSGTKMTVNIDLANSTETHSLDRRMSTIYNIGAITIAGVTYKAHRISKVTIDEHNKAHLRSTLTLTHGNCSYLLDLLANKALSKDIIADPIHVLDDKLRKTAITE